MNPEAYRQYLVGRKYWNERTSAGIVKSIACIHQAIQDDPNFALAYAGLADSLLFDNDPEIIAEAKAAARKAIDLDPTLGEPHTSLAFIALMRDWEWELSKQEFQRAIQLSPNDATAHHWYAFYFEKMGRPQDAIRELNRAVELDPLSPVIRSALADGLSEMGQHDKALEEIQKVLDIDPRFGKAYLIRANIHERRHMFPQAIAEMKKAQELGISRGEAISRLAYLHARAGDRAEAEKAIQEMKRRAKLANQLPPPDDIAMIYVALGNRDQAFAWLEKGRELHSEFLLNLKWDLAFDPLRSDPRFQALLESMNFPP